MSKKKILIELIETMGQEERTLVADLSDQERAAQGQTDSWSIKDNLVHLALWDLRLAENLAAISSGAETRSYPDYEAINDADFLEHQEDTWEQAIEILGQSRRSLLEALGTLDANQLEQTELLPSSQERRPLWRLIVSNSVMHSLIHIAEYYTARGDNQVALDLLENISTRLLELDDQKEWRGVIVYNLACYHALAGHSGKALRMLGQALSLNPELTEWSKEDSDLASLRLEPAYNSLYE